jgi:hypothetical protein
MTTIKARLQGNQSILIILVQQLTTKTIGKALSLLQKLLAAVTAVAVAVGVIIIIVIIVMISTATTTTPRALMLTTITTFSPHKLRGKLI